MNDKLPEHAREFIHKHIHSVAQLEILLMLRKERERTWTSVEVTNTLYLQSQMVIHLLTDIVQRGFAIHTQGCFRYQPTMDRDHELIDLLAQLYQERRVAVITEIFSKPTDFIKAFADAFRLRKEE